MDTEDQPQPSRRVPPDLTPGSWSVEPIEAGVRVEIRPHRDWLYGWVSLAGTASILVFGLKLSGGPSTVFGMVILAIFVWVALGVLRTALINLADRHVLEIRPAGLRVASFVGALRLVREYEREQITWIEVEDGPLAILEEYSWLGIRAALRLNGQRKRYYHRIPLGLTRAEAWEIVDLYKRHTEGTGRAPVRG